MRVDWNPKKHIRRSKRKKKKTLLLGYQLTALKLIKEKNQEFFEFCNANNEAFLPKNINYNLIKPLDLATIYKKYGWQKNKLNDTMMNEIQNV